MKTIIIYDSLYGNTKIIAETIKNAIFQEATMMQVKNLNLSDLDNYDLLIVGSPTHAGRPTEDIKKFLQNIPDASLQNKHVAVFDTRASSIGQSWWLKTLMNILGYAAIHLQKGLEKKGGQSIIVPTGFMVKGKEGPLEDGELEKAKKWGQEIYNQVINQSKS